MSLAAVVAVTNTWTVIRKKASQLEAGDVFYREAYRVPDPRVDSRYTVERLQRIPVHDFFGKLHVTIQVTARHHLLGPAKVTLGDDEEVWVAEGDEAGQPLVVSPDEDLGRRPWSRRKRLPRRPRQ